MAQIKAIERKNIMILKDAGAAKVFALVLAVADQRVD
jgi:hypothetical protein